MSGKNYQIAAYEADRPLKMHEQRMLEVLAEAGAGKARTLFDIGCADGTMLAAIKTSFPNLTCAGMDLSEMLIAQGRERFSDIELSVGDAASLDGRGMYDIAIASGILSVFEEHEKILADWMSHINPGGVLIVFGRFNTADIDTVIRFRVGARSAPWEGGWSAYSLKSIREIAGELGASVNFERYIFPGRLPKSDNPVKTFNIIGDDGERYLINRGNVIAEHYFAVLRKP